jgi:hypothetical protein
VPDSVGVEVEAGRTQTWQSDRPAGISVKGITYQRLKDFCDTNGLSVSGYLEKSLRKARCRQLPATVLRHALSASPGAARDRLAALHL